MIGSVEQERVLASERARAWRERRPATGHFAAPDGSELTLSQCTRSQQMEPIHRVDQFAQGDRAPAHSWLVPASSHSQLFLYRVTIVPQSILKVVRVSPVCCYPPHC